MLIWAVKSKAKNISRRPCHWAQWPDLKPSGVHRKDLLYSDAALSAVTSHCLCLPAGLRSHHQRKRCLNFTFRLSVHGHRRFTYQPSAYLWHCCWYILFTAPVSEVWEPPSSASPIEHPPTHPPPLQSVQCVVLLGKGQIGTPFSGAISKFNVAILLPLISLLCSNINYSEPMHVYFFHPVCVKLHPSA